MSPTVPRMPAPRPAQAPRVPMMPAPSPIQSAQQPLSSGGMASMNGLPMLPGYQAPGMQMPPGNSVMLNSDDLAVQGQVIADQMDTIVTGMQQVALFTGQIETAWRALLVQTKAVQQESNAASSPDGMAPPVPSGAEDAKPNRVKAEEHRAEPSRFTRLAEMAGAADLGAREQRRADGTPASGPRVAGRRRDGSPAPRPPEGGTDPRHNPDALPPIQSPRLGASLAELRVYGAQHATRAIQNVQGRLNDTTVHGGRHLLGGPHPRINQMLTRASGFMGNLGAEDGSLLGGLGAAVPELLEIAGPAAALISAGVLANKFAISQRAANATYQNIYGGSNISQFGQRAQEIGFAQLGTLGLLSSDEATRLFQNVSATGIQGNDRQNALDFALTQYSKTGMSTDLSTRLIEQSVENGVTNFTGLSNALDKVSAAAERTGQSVGKAQEAFVQTYSQISQVTNTSAGSDIAGALQAYRTGQGRGLSTLNPTAALADVNQQYLSASLLGMDSQTFIARSSTDPGLMGQALNKRTDLLKASVINQSQMGDANNLIAEMKRKNGGKALTDDQLGEVGRKMMESGAANVQQLQAVAAAYGMGNISEAEAPTYLAKLAANDPTLSATSEFAKDTGGFNQHYRTTIAGDQIEQTSDGTAGFWHPGIDTQDNRLKRFLGYHSKHASGGPGIDNASVRAGFDAYSKIIHRTGGQRLEGIEDLLKAGNGTDFAGKYKVKDKNGQTKSVSLAEAIAHYSGQLESGDAEFDSGKYKGQSVGSVTGVYDRGTAKAAAAAATSGTVVISAKGALQQYIDMVATGNASVAGSKRNGVPAQPFASTPNDYTSATP